MTDIRFVAKTYLDAGWSVVPLIPGKKKAASDWSKTTYGPADFGPNDNIAGKCGEPSQHRVDVDCDALEAVAAAKHLLPATGLIHGRPGKPSSHFWYLCEGVKTAQWSDVKDSAGEHATLIEVRSTGGYTALPPSIWSDKYGVLPQEQMVWELERAPASISPEDLLTAVRYVATAALLAKHWPGAGGKHHMVGHLAGFLASAKIPDFMIVEIIRVAATVAKDPDVHDRVVFAQGTLAKHAAGVPVTGGPKLAEAIGDHVVGKLRGWYRLVDTEALEGMNAKHFVVTMGKDTVIGREDHPGGVIFQVPKALSIEYANQFCAALDRKGAPTTKPIFDEWLKSRTRRTYTRVVFAPPPQVAREDEYNLWRGFAVEPAGDGSADGCDRFLEHLHDTICDGITAHYEYLLNLLAATVQAPGAPLGVATVLRGGQGSGKGLFVRTIGDFFGRRHYTQLDKVEQLAGKFNAALSGKIIVFADEAFFAGDKREIGALKRLITEPSLHIERKGIDGTDEDNHVHLFMATNERWSWPAAIDDRRGFLLKVSDARREDHDYFQAIADELDRGGRAALLGFLLQRSVNLKLIKNVPKTAERQLQQSISLGSLEPHLEWWNECLYDGMVSDVAGWPQFVATRVLYERYTQWGHGQRRRIISKIEFGRVLGEYFSASGKSMMKRFGREHLRVYDLRPLADARAYFDLKLGRNEEWPDTQAGGGTEVF